MVAPSGRIGMFRTLSAAPLRWIRSHCRVAAFLPVAFVAISSHSMAQSTLVVVPAQGKSLTPQADLNRNRLAIRLKWAPYHTMAIRQPDGKEVLYSRPDVTQTRMLDAPLSSASQFAIGNGMTLTLRPRRWEQSTQRFVLESTVDSDPDSKDPSPAEHTVQTASGTLQSTGEGKWLFVGESRWTVYSPTGDLVAEFSLGTFPETTDAPPPPVAQRD